MSRPGELGTAAPQALSDLGAGRRVGDRTTARQQVADRTGIQRAAFTGPARYPGQLGPGGVDELGDRGEQTRDLGGPLPDQYDGTGRTQRGRSLVVGRRIGNAGRGGGVGRERRTAAPASSPGTAVSSVPDIFSSPRDRSGATEKIGTPRRDALRSRRNRIGDSSSGSRARPAAPPAPSPARRR